MAFSNADKSKHGRSAQDSLAAILNRCYDAGYLEQVIPEYRAGIDGFNDKQFFAPFLIVFKDGARWALFTATSMRTDRIKGHQWDAFNLKRIDPKITRVYMVYPDGIEEKIEKEFIRKNQKYADKIEYSMIDAIVSQNDISDLIEAYAIKDKSFGQTKDIQGKGYEDRVADILSFQQNLEKWKTDDITATGMHYDIFKNIVECFGLDKTATASIKATSDKKQIGVLPSGGNPKTDVLVSVTFTDGSSKHYTISCKRSSARQVSVHEYSADIFADVLDKENSSLRELLNLFQKAGNMRDFGTENAEKLTQELSPYFEKLTKWVLGGHGGAGNPDTQFANYILVYDDNSGSSSIHSIEQFVRRLIDDGASGNFGTPFHWTYPSKKRGKKIQLKLKCNV
ncbi:MAG: MspI family type II restriction endonuclease [Lachnospiraceae bacterium]|nr:MspI family type II restriction endonuclease [Lachnospiraceae bacterium]